MIDIYRLDHLGQVVTDLHGQVDFLRKLFGFEPIGTWESAEELSRGAMLRIPGTPVRWEIQAPTGEDSPLQSFLGPKQRPGLHHVALEVPDFEGAGKAIGELGLGLDTLGSGDRMQSTLLPEGAPAGLKWRIFGPDSPGRCGGVPSPESSSRDSSDPSETLGIIGIDHVCQAYRHRDELARHYEQVFGMREVYRTPDDAHPDLADLVMTIPGTQARWEIIMPQGAGSFIEKFLETRGASAHHVTFEVRDWDQALAACQRHEVPTFDGHEGETSHARWRDAFIHPRYTGGILVQLFWEERPGVWCRSDKIPPGRST